MYHLISKRLQESIELKDKVVNNNVIQEQIYRLSCSIIKAISDGNKILVCGNGGSASDASHFVSELVGRFQKERLPWPAITLNGGDSTLTAIANDYGYENVFARQVDGYANKGDVFIGISTSGNSENVFRAVQAAKRKGSITAALLGNDGGKIREAVDIPIIIPDIITARIQECHITIIHIICEIVETKLGEDN
jgi:D-sedoheptulose 7-phosphate isomerase